jgi:hypothetical protein
VGDYVVAQNGHVWVCTGAGTSGTWADAGAGGGIADEGTFTYLDAVGAAAPGNPAAGNARIYAKTDGRIYSRDNGGTEYGPFDAAGGGGPTYVIDDTFPGSSLPSGWAFTGVGTCAVTGGVAEFRGGAVTDRLMHAITPTTRYFVEGHYQNTTGTGGMPSICVLDSTGNGYGLLVYNDGNSYIGNVVAYTYTSFITSGIVYSQPTLTDLWFSAYTIGSEMFASAYSTDGGTTWNRWVVGIPGSTFTMTQFGLVQLFTSANISVDVAEMRMQNL